MKATQVCSAGLLVTLLWFALPVPLPSSPSSASSHESCLSIADASFTSQPHSLAELEQCSALLPADAELLAELGQAYEAARQWSQAEASYQRVLVLDKDHADVRLRLGRLMLNRGAAADAMLQAKAALLVQPNRTSLRHLLEEATRSVEGERR